MNEIIFSKKGLSLERLNLLVRIAEAGGIRAAVGDDPARQSLASRQMSELAEYVGVDLWKRNGRNIDLTETGRELAEISNEFFERLGLFLRATRQLPNVFKLGAGDSIFQWHILPQTKLLQSHLGNAQLQSFSYSAAEIVRKVETRSLDAGLVRKTAIPTGSDLVIEDIGEIKYCLFVPKTLIPDSFRAKELPPLSTIPFCNLTGDGEYAKALNKLITAFSAIPSLSCSSMTQMYAAVESCQYAAVLPTNAEINLPTERIASYALPELAPFTRRIALIFKSDALEDQTRRKIIGFLRTIFQRRLFISGSIS